MVSVSQVLTLSTFETKTLLAVDQNYFVSGLNRSDMIGLALLLGCDYSPGVPDIDKDMAVKLLEVLKGEDILDR